MASVANANAIANPRPQPHPSFSTFSTPLAGTGNGILQQLQLASASGALTSTSITTTTPTTTATITSTSGPGSGLPGLGPPGTVNGNRRTQIQTRGIFEELHQSRLSITHDRQALDQSRKEISACKAKVSAATEKLRALQEKLDASEKEHSERATELCHVEIRERILSESLASVETDLSKNWDELQNLRKESLQLSNSFLREANDFALTYNCTELGQKHRAVARVEELESLRLKKYQLEYELETFLNMLKKVEDSENENAELEQEFKNQNEVTRTREEEAYAKLDEIEDKLNWLRKKDSTLDKELDDELNRLRNRLQAARESISQWERRVAEKTSSSSTNPTMSISSSKFRFNFKRPNLS